MASPEAEAPAPAPAEETPLPGVAEGPAPAPEPESPVSAAPEPAPAPTSEPEPAAGGGASGGAGVSASAGVSADVGGEAPAPEPTVTKEAPRDNARSHESRLAFSGALLLHSARQGGARTVVQQPDPGFAITSELRVARDENSHLWLGLEGAYWNQRDYGRTVALRAQFGYRLTFDMGLGAEIYGGPGLAFHRYQQAAQHCGCTNGRPRQTGFVGGMGVGLVYDFGQISHVPLAVYARYESFIERHLGAPRFYLVPHHAVHVGLRFTIPGRKHG